MREVLRIQGVTTFEFLASWYLSYAVQFAGLNLLVTLVSIFPPIRVGKVRTALPFCCCHSAPFSPFADGTASLLLLLTLPCPPSFSVPAEDCRCG
eukprot:SAG22_NODE_205_length_15308_cov_20.539023_18_plen_95_part_00